MVDKFLKVVALCLLVSTFLACSSKLEVGSIDLDNWKTDRNGCNGLRLLDLEELQRLKNSFLSANNQELIKTFGRPDRVLLVDKSQSFFIYFLDPSDACGEDVSANDPLKLMFRLNAVSRVSEVNITTLDP